MTMFPVHRREIYDRVGRTAQYDGAQRVVTPPRLLLTMPESENQTLHSSFTSAAGLQAAGRALAAA